MMRTNLLLAGPALAGLMLGLAACGGKPAEFGAETALAADKRPANFGLDQRQRFGLQDMRGASGGSRGDQPTEPQGGGAAARFEGDVPSDWQKMPPTEMRQLNYRVANAEQAECYLTTGNLRGGVLANVNRWVANQFGNEPLTAAQFAALPRYALLGQPAVLVEVEGAFAGMGGGEPKADWKLLGLVGGGDDDMVTLKFTGPRAVVDAQRDAFLAFAASIRPAAKAGGVAPASAPATPSAAFQAATPTGWQVAAPSEFRQLNWRIQQDGECYLTAGNLGGGKLANANRWVANQFGQQPLTAAQFAALPRFPLLGEQATLVEVEGPFAGMGGGAPKADWKLLGLMGGTDDAMVTLKFTGPKALVDAERAAFLALAASIAPGSAAAKGATNAPTSIPPAHGADDPLAHGVPQDGNHGGVPPDGSHGGAAAAPFAATIPAGWTPLEDTGSRVLRHRFGAQGECYVGQLGGDLAQMLGIWCAEMSSPTPDAAGIAALPKVTMLGTEGVLLDLAGDYQSMGGQKMPGARSLVAVVQQDGAILFAKCLGPAAEVEAARAGFTEFVKTLRRNP